MLKSIYMQPGLVDLSEKFVYAGCTAGPGVTGSDCNEGGAAIGCGTGTMAGGCNSFGTAAEGRLCIAGSSAGDYCAVGSGGPTP